MSTYTSTVVEILDNGDAVLQFSPEMIAALNWTEGMEVEILLDDAGRILIKRVE